MSKNTLVISVETRETRVALIEGGIIAELHLERRGQTNSGTVGNIVLGKVTRVLPGLQAAFIDVDQERAAFLHVEDLIRPTDFEAYLYGGSKTEKSESQKASLATDPSESAEDPSPENEADGEDAGGGDVEAGEEGASLAPPALDETPDAGESRTSLVGLDRPSVPFLVDRPSEPEYPSLDDTPEEDSAGGEDDDEEEREEAALEDDEPDDGEIAEATPTARSSHVHVGSGSLSDVAMTEAQGDLNSSVPPPPDAAVGEGVSPLATLSSPSARPGPPDDFEGLPGFTISDPNDPMPRAQVPRGDRRGRGRGRSRSRGREGREERRPREAKNPLHQNRLSKSTPIQEVVKEGQEIIVQISKDPISTKGARCTSHVSLAGRYVVYLPTVEHIGISKRIGSERERGRLREVIESIRPPKGGLIVRTVAEGLTKKQLKQDIGYLVRLWEEISKKREGAKAPVTLYSELDLVLKTARDLFTDEVDSIVIDDKHQYERLVRFVEMFAPDRLKDIQYYGGDEPIFDAYGIEDEIARALSRKVPLPSGGYLVIDQAEALTAIDVNTGRFVGKGSKDLEETILKTNLEAVHEIAYQLRFRNIGGLIILDLIDMEKSQSREKVRRELDDLLRKDKAKTSLNRISDLGLIEMTRKRTRESLGRLLNEPCFYCDGTGHLQSKETIAYEILRELRRRRNDLPGYTVVVNAHPAICDVLQGEEKAAIQDAENKYMRKIIVTPRKEYHYEQFDLQGK